MVSDIVNCGESPVEALFGEDRDFDFRHVEPTGMFGRVVPNNSFEEPTGTLFAECFHQRLGVMSIQIVEHQMDPSCPRVPLSKIANEAREVGPLAPTVSLDEAFAGLGFHGDEQAARAAAPILVVLFRRLAGAGRLRRAGMVEQLIGLLVQADYRLTRAERFFVLIEHVFHPLAKFLRELGNTPRFFRQGLRSWA